MPGITAGGYFWRPSTEGDSLTSMQWWACPDIEPRLDDYLYALDLVDDAMPFEDEVKNMNLSGGTYSVEVTVDGEDVPGVLHDEMEETEDEDEDDVGAANDEPDAIRQPVDASERALFGDLDIERGTTVGTTLVTAPELCDLCKTSLLDRNLLIDGKMQGSTMWGFMCANCFLGRGAGLGWGSGQAYIRRSDNSWLLVAGFPPDEYQANQD